MKAKNALKQLKVLNQTGPRVEASSVKVYNDGKILRISPDLVRALASASKDLIFLAFVDRKAKVLVLKLAKAESEITYRTWVSSPGKSRSVLLAVSGLLNQLGITEKDAPGVYSALVGKKELRIDFSKKV